MILLRNLIDLDDDGRWNIMGNTYNGNSWSRFANKHLENLYIYTYIFRTIKASSEKYWSPYTCLYSPDDALIVRNIYIVILWVYIC